MRLSIYIAIGIAALQFNTCEAGGGASGTVGIPDFLLNQASQVEDRSGLINGIQMSSTKRAAYRDNPKWIEYQERRKARKDYALRKRAAYNNSKNWSRVALSHHIPIDITNPLNINPWSNYRGNARFHRRPLARLPLIPWSPNLEILSPGNSLQ